MGITFKMAHCHPVIEYLDKIETYGIWISKVLIKRLDKQVKNNSGLF